MPVYNSLLFQKIVLSIPTIIIIKHSRHVWVVLTGGVHVVRHVVLVDVALYAGQHGHLAPPRARDTGRRAVLTWAGG